MATEFEEFLRTEKSLELTGLELRNYTEQNVAALQNLEREKNNCYLTVREKK